MSSAARTGAVAELAEKAAEAAEAERAKLTILTRMALALMALALMALAGWEAIRFVKQIHLTLNPSPHVERDFNSGCIRYGRLK